MNHIIFSLYSSPFTIDKYGCYVFDSDNNVVADFNDGDTFRTRGWGRIKSQCGAGAEEIYNSVERFLIDLIKGNETNKAACVAILNDAWRNKKT